MPPKKKTTDHIVDEDQDNMMEDLDFEMSREGKIIVSAIRADINEL